MRPFAYSRADTVQAAVQINMASEMPANSANAHAPNQYVAGGTTFTQTYARTIR